MIKNLFIIPLLLGLTACAIRPTQETLPTASAETPADSMERLFDRLFLEAVCQKEEGNLDAEYDLLEQALALRPQAPEALYEKALLLRQYNPFRGDSTQPTPLTLLEQATCADTAYIPYRKEWAWELVQSGNLDEATRQYGILMDKDFNDRNGNMLLYLHFFRKDFSASLSLLDRLETRRGKTEEYSDMRFEAYAHMGEEGLSLAQEYYQNDTTDIQTCIRLIRLLQAQPAQHDKHLTEAGQLARRALRGHPGHPGLQYALFCTWAADSTANASDMSQLATDILLNPHAPASHKATVADYCYTHAHNRIPMDTMTLDSLLVKALETPQDHIDLWQFYGQRRQSQNASEAELVEILHKMLDVTPNDNSLRMTCLYHSLTHEDLDQALALCEEGLLYSPDQLEYYYYAGYAHSAGNRNQEAIQILCQGASVFEEMLASQENAATGHAANLEEAARIYALLGDLHHDEGNNDLAYKAYERCLDLNPTDYECINNYAYYLALDGCRLDRAEELIRQAVEHSPDNCFYLDTYAWVLYARNEFTQARIYIDQALERIDQADRPDIYFSHAGDIYARCKLTREAIHFWEKALSLARDPEMVRELKRKIKRRSVQ